jgi:hypothetical protein
MTFCTTIIIEEIPIIAMKFAVVRVDTHGSNAVSFLLSIKRKEGNG